ncbi:isopentenyl-diphosphate Delta-isomerase [Candidatus Woesearchaeota archaeon]|nr:isopentenyl-diphosphate Delta-isomerase [Candidatus Woesearchaeota archaeon]
MEEKVILVDAADNQIGTEEKLEAHRQGKLHRAFSTCIFNDKGELMLQKRDSRKYHSGGLWTNTCCSHPRPGEGLLEAAHRRLKEEMGFDCDLKEAFSFVYEAKLDKGLTEHEFNHVIIGQFNGKPILNPLEAEDWRWSTLEELRSDIEANPEKYSFWLKACFKQLERAWPNTH